MLSYTLVVLVISSKLLVLSYPNGAPNSACESLLPVHGVPPQLGYSLQYIVEVDRDKLPENGRVQIILKSPHIGYTISGFMVQARTVMDQFPRIVGSFIEYDNEFSKSIQCAERDDTLTHAGPNSKNEIVAIWQAPRGFIGSIVFNATIAESFSKFWSGVISIPIQVLPAEIFGGSIDDNYEVTIGTTPAWRRPTYVFEEYTPKYIQEKKQSFIQNFYDDCFKSKNCFGAPADCLESRDCDIVTAILAKRDHYEFELLATNPRSAYAAVALSADDKMGDDSVMECVKQSPNSIKAYMSWTVGKSVERLNTFNGIQLLNQSVIDGSLYCRIGRNIQTIVRGRSFDLIRDKHHILVATGSHVHPNKVGYHDIAYLAAAEPIALSNVRRIEASSNLLIRLHGSLMLVSWIGLASIGILMARYYRQTWVNTSFCGKDIWFMWHRLLMLLTWILTLVATIVIVIDLRAWSSETNPHAILGTLTVILCFFQPIGALFRPPPNTSKRPVFNWLHWLAGNAAHILAIIAIFFAVRLSKAQLPEWMDYILVAYIVFHVLVHLVLSILGCISNKAAISPESIYRPNLFPMKDMNDPRMSMPPNSIVKMDAPKSSFRKWILLVYLLTLTLLVVVMMTVIYMAPIDKSWQKFAKKFNL